MGGHSIARLPRIASFALAAMIVDPATAQDPGSARSRNFVESAAHSDNFEILEAQSALAESSDPQVRSFAQQMIAAHSETSRRLADAAMRAGMKFPPKGLNGDQVSFLSALQSQKGRDFDKIYGNLGAPRHGGANAVATGRQLIEPL
jgi:putative membrane protein